MKFMGVTVLRITPLILLLASCKAPIGTKPISARLSYAQVSKNALSGGGPSEDTLFQLHRYDLEKVFLKRGEDAIRELHAKAIATGDRDLLFALAEMSFLTGEQISRSIKPWEPRDARDYFLGAAVYAYLFLFFENDLPSAFDRRFRTACDLYNYGLGLALQKQHSTQGLIELNNMTRKLPVGELDIALDVSEFPWPMSEFEQFLLGGEFQVRGLSVRNRVSGLGTPLIAVPSRTIGYGLLRTTGATVFLRLAGGLKELASGHCHGALELRSAFGKDAINRGTQSVPLERDLTVPMAFNLNQSIAWELHKHQFLSLHEIVPSDVYSTQPYESGRIPVVFVHGTYSSPVRWAEMLNTLRADPELRSRYQFWFFIYNSSAPLVVSAGKLRRGIAARIAEFDPEGRDDALKHIVVIGHSQGGLLAKLISTNTKDKLWRAISEKPVDELNLSPAQKDEVRRLFFLESMPAVTRVVFIATPHRGSYWARGFVRIIARRLIRVPASLAGRAREVTTLALQLKLPDDVDRRKITSVDSMSPKSPLLKALADLPVAPQVKAHSIIPVRSRRLIERGNDGVVKYTSAHLEGVESELIVKNSHSCQSTPATIEEIRRILHVHLN